jgi:hypothetical protein
MEQLKFYAKIASASLLRWLLISGSGLLLSAIGLFVALHLLGNNAGASWGTAAREELWTAALLLGSLALPAITFVLANKITLGFVLYGLFENKLLPLIGDRVAALVGSFIARQGGLAETLSSVSTLRDKLVTLAGEDSTLNKIQRKAVRYGLARVRLDDIDFRQPDLNLPGVIAGRVVETLQAAAEPGYQLFWIVATSHVALLIFALLFDHT